MSTAAIVGKAKRFQPQRVRVAIATAYTMWTQCGSCARSRKCRTHSEPDADSVECCACIDRVYKKIYGGQA
jgi:hypothetical protein